MNARRRPKRTNDFLTKSVARRLKTLRAQRGFSQEFVNENTGLNLPRIEAGTTTLSLVSLALLCEFYDISLHDFFDGIEVSPPRDEPSAG